MRKVVVIGGSAAGMMAAIAAARQNPNTEVTVVTRDQMPYRRPAIPALIAGYITSQTDARIFSPGTLAEYGIKLLFPAEAVNLDPENKVIAILSNGKEEKLAYDAAVIATGGRPLIPKIPGNDKAGVCTFMTYEAAEEIAERAKNANNVVVVGAGFIALEIAETLMHKGLNVYFNVRSRILRRLLEPEVSDFLMYKFERQGLRMLTGEAISEIGGKDRVEYVVHKGSRIAADIVVMGTGVRPDVAIVERCGIEQGLTGAVKVDNRMQTSVADIYAAGDCAESPDLSTGGYVYSPVGSIGAMAGKVAGVNAAGGNLQSKGFLRAQADRILGMQIFSIGHSTTSAKEVNLSVKVHDLALPELRGAFETAKLLTDKRDRVVGAQLVAGRYGSQFAWQLYKAVVTAEDREEFMQRFTSPRMDLAETLLRMTNVNVEVESYKQGRALKLVDSVE